MTSVKTSPRITKLSWGRIDIEGVQHSFKDAKLFPGGAREWDWNETGTRHVPGIQPTDVAELLDHDAKAVVLSKGIYERLGVCSETLEMLKKKNIEVRVCQTEKAVQLYNELSKTELVGGLFHTTC